MLKELKNTANLTYTENGAATNLTSFSDCVDLFGTIGALRHADDEEVIRESAQFDVTDRRTLDEVVGWLLELGYIPSFCTACYREGRTGDRFMSLVKTGKIACCCGPNALMTLKEYLVDYASPHTRELGEAMIARELKLLPSETLQKKIGGNIAKIEEGLRDFYI